MAYKNKKEMIAMLLAGGQGSRLGVLTNSVAKPAVPFGGKYRIIDFPLSNCTNSSIDTVGILTQYQPLELNEYIGSGIPWDLDRIRGGISILPPYTTSKAGEWYQGTANAIYQNMHFIEMYNPEYVLILSGDHVYKMNYRMMLDFHKEQNADCTISVMEVPWEEAGRFGVMSTDEDMRIYEFEEKPQNPKSNLASMGVYIFTWSKLKEYLIMDEKNMESGKDFGKDVIPYILQKGQRLFAYRYLGYWKDVGTIDSLWEANMDLLDPNVPIDLDDPPWKIFSRNEPNPPQFIGSDAEIGNSMISEGSSIYGKVENSILFPGVVVEEGARISSSILMDGAVVKKNAKVEFSILDVDVKIGENCHIGWTEQPDEPEKRRDITVIGEGAEILADSVISAGELIDSRSRIGPDESSGKTNGEKD